MKITHNAFVPFLLQKKIKEEIGNNDESKLIVTST